MTDNQHQIIIAHFQRQLPVLPLHNDNIVQAAVIRELGAAHYGASRINR